MSYFKNLSLDLAKHVGGGGSLNSKNSALKTLTLFAALFVAFLIFPTDLPKPSRKAPSFSYGDIRL